MKTCPFVVFAWLRMGRLSSLFYPRKMCSFEDFIEFFPSLALGGLCKCHGQRLYGFKLALVFNRRCTPPKTNMTMEKQPWIEDGFPIEKYDVPLSCWFQGGWHYHWCCIFRPFPAVTVLTLVGRLCLILEAFESFGKWQCITNMLRYPKMEESSPM